MNRMRLKPEPRRLHLKSTIQPASIGQDFDDFLKEDGIASEAEARAIKKVEVALAKDIGTSQTQLADRFEAARGRADIKWSTDELMALLRAAD